MARSDMLGKLKRSQRERDQELKIRFEQTIKETADKYPGVNLYVKNLDDSIDDEKRKELFAEFGTITSCKVMRDPSGISRGSGFVAFSTPEEASRALSEMNGKMVISKPLYVAIAQRKEERRARLQGQQGQRPSGRRGGPVPQAQQLVPMMQEQMLPRGRMYRYPSGCNVVDGTMPGVGGMLSAPSNMGRMLPSDAATPQLMPITALASALANTTPEQQRTMLGENLYPQVDQLEPEHATKVTGMLLEMDQTEVLHLLESPNALKAKVAEAMEVLRNVQQANAPADQLASLSLNDNLIS